MSSQRSYESAQKKAEAERKVEEQRLKEKRAFEKRKAQVERQADAESMSNQRRQIQIKAQLAAMDKKKSITNSALTKDEIDRYKELSRELSLLIERQRELNRISKGSGARAKERLSTYEISESEKAMQRYGSSVSKAEEEQNKMLRTLQRLGSAFGVAFSVRGLVQFGKKLIETRGQFEMQFVAMKQIIGDVDAATKIWNQTMQQALQSPFKAMQLVTYTKQLAAYRIETEKLFDTTKRLADISAGLGVDMGRLILAYGQVKSANFLRASEVRQFTEAGVNIVGGLAKYFTEVENRVVSTADVMERITKRMVMFSDVEEILRRMTDAGGEFYNMQEVQANTVKGQIMKLHDAYEQMLNTIGQANQGTLRNFIDTLNKLVRNWRDVASFLTKNVYVFGALIPILSAYRKGVRIAGEETLTWSAAMQMAKGSSQGLFHSLRSGQFAMKAFVGAVSAAKAALSTFVPLLAIEGLIFLITKLTESTRRAKELEKALDEVGSKNMQSLQDNIDGFDKLKKELEEATEGSQNYLDVRNKIQSQYGEYLDNLTAEQITVENLANSYNKVVERMREKSRQHIMEEGLEEITKDYGKYFNDFVTDISKFSFSTGLKISREEAVNVAKIARELYEKNDKYRGLSNTSSLFKDALEKYGFDTKGLNFVQLQWKDFYDAIERSYSNQLELETKANSLTKATSDTHKEYLDQLALEEEHEKNIAKLRDDASIKSSGRLQLAIQAENLRYEEKKLELQAKYQKKGDEWLNRQKDALKENYGDFLNAYNEQVKAYIGGKYGAEWMQGDEVEAWAAYNFMIANQDRLSQGQSKWEEKILNDKKLTEENIKRIKEQQATQTAADAKAKEALNESLKKEEDRLELIKKQMELLGLHEKETGNRGSSNNSIYSDRIKLLQDMLQKYKQLAKEAYGYAKAEGKVKESFDDAWNNIMPSEYGGIKVPKSYSALAKMLERLEEFTPAIDKNGNLSKMLSDLKKAVADALSQVDVEMSVSIREDFGEQMEKAFGDYELTLELQKLNISPDAAKDLFPEFDSQTLGNLQDVLQDFYKKQGENFSEEDFKVYKQWSDKIEAEILKSRKERAKEYSKFLEKEYSERAKVEMQYAKDVAFVTANFQGDQQKNILKGIEDKHQKNINELTWKSFKESTFYVEMMDDLSSVPADYMKIMLEKIEELLKNPETLSPRALKEAINARQKILEAQMDIDSIAVMRESIGDIWAAANRVGGSTWAETKKRLDEEQNAQAEKLKGLEEEINKNKTLQGQLKGLEDVQKAESDAKKALSTETIADLGDLDDAESLVNEYSAKLAVATDAIENNTDEKNDNNVELEREIADLRIAIDLLEQYNNAKQGRIAYENTKEGQAALSAQAGGQTSSSIGAEIASEQERADEVSNNLSELKKWQKAFKNFSDGMTKWNAAVAGAITKVGEMGNAFYDTFEALGGETNALTEGWKEFGNTMVQTITQALALLPQLITGFITAGTSINSAMGVVGLVAEAIQLILVAVQAFAKLHDSSYEREIEIQQEKIDDLQRAYDRLEKSIEKTWSTTSYIRDYRKETQNLYEQVQALNAQMNAENAKKNTDKNKIQDYEDKIQDAEDKLDELKQKQIEVFGGIGTDSYRSAAEEFVSAWKDAFLETGDGLQGLQDHFDEFLQEWFVKQATMRVAANALEPLFRKIDAAVDPNGPGGADVIISEIRDINQFKELILSKTNDQLEALAGIFDLSGEGSLSGLAAGIQGMTEEQANILEAYWNSVRMYTASIDMNVARITEILGGGGDRSNPQLTYLSGIEKNTGAIYAFLQDAAKSGHTKGGVGIKVFVD